MMFKKITLAVAAIAAGWLFAGASAYAQGSKTMQLVGKYCPIGFSDRKGQCVGNGDYIGYYKGGKGNCPKDWRSSKDYCVYSANDTARDVLADEKMNSGEWTYARLPLLQRVAKAAETDLCPSGYFTHRTDLKLCVTHFKDAPKSRLASGGKCGAGETLERGKYCTGTTAMSAKEFDLAMTVDFNELYTGYGVKHGQMRSFEQTPPEVAAPSLATLNAEKKAASAKEEAANAEVRGKAKAEETALNNHRNEQQRIACEAGRPNFPTGFPPGHPCHGLASGAQADLGGSAAAQGTQEPAKDIAKQELSKALRGLLGR